MDIEIVRKYICYLTVNYSVSQWSISEKGLRIIYIIKNKIILFITIKLRIKNDRKLDQLKIASYTDYHMVCVKLYITQ